MRVIRDWRRELDQIPSEGQIEGLHVFYPRYTSPPKQIFHSIWGFFAYFFIFRLIKDLDAKYNFHLIHAHYATPGGVIALLANRWMNVPVVLSIHGSDLTYTVRQNRLSEKIIKQVFQRSDTITANSTWTAAQLRSYGVDPGKIQIVRLGGDPPIEYPPASPVNPPGSISLLTVGYLEDRKGQAYVLRALSELRREGYDLYYVMVGNGSKQDELVRLAHDLGLSDCVSFEGYKPHVEVWSYYDNCDIFVLPSWKEAFGIVYTEALSFGKPVIGCMNEGGPEDLRSLGDCIELVKPRDVQSLTMAIKRLVDDPQRRKLMGKIGQQIVRKHYTWDVNSADTINIYRRLLNRTNG